MILARVLGFLIFLGGLTVLVRDSLVWVDTGRWMPLAFGEAWHDIDRASLNMAQAAVERFVAPGLWNPVFTGILSLWICAVLIAIGGVLIVSSRRSSSARR